MGGTYRSFLCGFLPIVPLQWARSTKQATANLHLVDPREVVLVFFEAAKDK